MTIERHNATVMSNADPEKRGCIQVACTALLGDEETTIPMWVEPVLDWGWFLVPDVGESVEIEVFTSSDDDEQFGQSSINGLDMKWTGARYYTQAQLESMEKNEPRPVHQDFTATNYGKRRGFATPFGHVLLFDDTESAPTVYMTFMKSKLTPPESMPQPMNYTRLEFESDGSLKIGMVDKHVVHLQSDGNQLLVTMDGEKHKILLDANAASFTVELDSQKYTMKLDGAALEVKLQGATLKTEGMGANAKLTIGDGAKHVAIVEALEQFYGKLKTKLDLFDAHVHPTGMGPSGPPNPMIVADPWDPLINSTKISIPDL